MKVRRATPGLARNSRSLLRSAGRWLALSSAVPTRPPRTAAPPIPPAVTVPAARTVYQTWLYRLRIPQSLPQPDWSIADLWIAKELLSSGIPAAEVKTILQLGSPAFPRYHTAPDDYLHRTHIFGPFFKSKFLFQWLPRPPARCAFTGFTGAGAFGFSATAHFSTGRYRSP